MVWARKAFAVFANEVVRLATLLFVFATLELVPVNEVVKLATLASVFATLALVLANELVVAKLATVAFNVAMLDVLFD